MTATVPHLDLTSPRIEHLLAAAHQVLPRLRQRREVLIRAGVNREMLPSDHDLRAIALLGDHDRDDMVERLRSAWPNVLAQGLASGALVAQPTPLIRLMVQSLPLTAAIDTIWNRFQHADGQVRAADPGTIDCAAHVSGHWGQMARVHFRIPDVVHMLIRPDSIFATQPALIAADPTGWCAGSLSVPIDNGGVSLTWLTRDGAMLRHIVRFDTGGE
ncbi:hypothetical protein IP70_16670 [alpha proteobacterium AAP38]|nr:hypothetical protein IP70_16670 [alpha proteobacterium AAP38]